MASAKLLILCLVGMLTISQTHCYFRAGRYHIHGDLTSEERNARLVKAIQEYLKAKKETAEQVIIMLELAVFLPFIDDNDHVIYC